MRVRNITNEPRQCLTPRRLVQPDEVITVPNDGRTWPESTWEVIRDGSLEDE